jgi:glycosyltransferase involved in cell wall biosynthesis
MADTQVSCLSADRIGSSPVPVLTPAARSPIRRRVVFVSMADLPEGGGNTTRLKMMAAAVAESGHEVTILNEHALGVAPQSSLCARGKMGAVEFRYVLGTVERGYGFRSIATKLRAVRALSREISCLHAARNIDVLWINNLSFYDTYPLTKLAQRLGIRTVQSYEDERWEVVTPGRSIGTKIFGLNSALADRYCPAMADAVVVISPYLKRKYAELRHNSERVFLIPTVVECDAWYSGPEPANDVPVLLYTGVFAAHDELENLLRAFVILRQQGHKFRVVMLGAAPDSQKSRMSEVKGMIERLGLAELVEMKGFVALDEVKRQVSRANVLLNIRRDSLWSRSGLSTKQGEYLSSGRLVVCTELGESSSYLTDGETAILVPCTTTASDIATAIARALASPVLRRKIGMAGRELAKRAFDISVVKDQLDNILQLVCCGAQGGSGIQQEEQ